MGYDISGAHVINKFSQAKLVEAGYVDMDDYSAGITSLFIPAQEQPEFTNLPTGVPYIVYNYANAGSYEEWWLEHEQIAYAVHCDDEKKIRQITHFLSTLYRREDWAGVEINDYIINNGTAEQKKFSFKYTSVISYTSPDPMSQEGGRQSGLVVIKYCYTNDLTQTGMRT